MALGGGKYWFYWIFWYFMMWFLGGFCESFPYYKWSFSVSSGKCWFFGIFWGLRVISWGFGEFENGKKLGKSRVYRTDHRTDFGVKMGFLRWCVSGIDNRLSAAADLFQNVNIPPYIKHTIIVQYYRAFKLWIHHFCNFILLRCMFGIILI